MKNFQLNKIINNLRMWLRIVSMYLARSFVYWSGVIKWTLGLKCVQTPIRSFWCVAHRLRLKCNVDKGPLSACNQLRCMESKPEILMRCDWFDWVLWLWSNNQIVDYMLFMKLVTKPIMKWMNFSTFSWLLHRQVESTLYYKFKIHSAEWLPVCFTSK